MFHKCLCVNNLVARYWDLLEVIGSQYSQQLNSSIVGSTDGVLTTFLADDGDLGDGAWLEKVGHWGHATEGFLVAGPFLSVSLLSHCHEIRPSVPLCSF
jgi:hypothetical protein